MGKIKLSWNSRTPNETIKGDNEFKKIIEFIKTGGRNKWVINFYCYDNKESTAFKSQLLKLLIDEFKNDNRSFHDGEIHFYDQEEQYNPKMLLKTLTDLATCSSGFIFLYEPIDYRNELSKSESQKYDIHKAIVNILQNMEFKLLLFGNIAYDIHHLKNNSPLAKFLAMEYEIKGYGKDELKALDTLKSDIRETIIHSTDGNFELIEGIEKFWDTIKMEKRAEELVKNFMEIPLKTKIEKMVSQKLSELAGFLERNHAEIGGMITYNEAERTLDIKNEDSTKLLRAYFDKTALFINAEITRGLYSYIQISPKEIFKETIDESRFFMNEGKLLKKMETMSDYSQSFQEIAAYFDHDSPTFILGAGTSFVSGAPVRILLFRKILSQIYPENEGDFKTMEYKSLSRNFQKMIKSRTKDDIRKRANDILANITVKPSIGHFHLAQLVMEKLTHKDKTKKIKTLITTNFDTLLEDSLMDYGIRSRDFIKLVAWETMTPKVWPWINDFPDHLKIYKICGDLYYDSWMALDDQAAKRWIKSSVDAMNQIHDFRDATFFIILGHKYDTKELESIFYNRRKENLKIIYANPEEKDCKEFEKKFKDECGDLKIISGHRGGFDNFMQQLCEQLGKNGKI